MNQISAFEFPHTKYHLEKTCLMIAEKPGYSARIKWERKVVNYEKFRTVDLKWTAVEETNLSWVLTASYTIEFVKNLLENRMKCKVRIKYLFD